MSANIAVLSAIGVCSVCLLAWGAMLKGSFGKYPSLTIGHNFKYSKEADDFVKDLLDNCEEARLTEFTLTIDGYEIWTENKFFGYCSSVGTEGKWNDLYRDVRISLRQAIRVYNLEKYLKDNYIYIKEDHPKP